MVVVFLSQVLLYRVGDELAEDDPQMLNEGLIPNESELSLQRGKPRESK